MNAVADSLALALQLIGGVDTKLVQIVTLSLQVSATAVVFGALVGLWLGAWLAVARFPGHAVLVWAMNTLLALPAVVVGLTVYLLLSRAGPLGSWGILFTPAAMVVAQTILVVPLIAALSRRLVQRGLEEGGDQLRSLGASPLSAAGLLLLHERFGVLTVLLTAFGRAVAEVGAVMIVGGNIDGTTRVMTTAIALETSKGDLPLALALGLVLLSVVGMVNLLIGSLQWRATTAGVRIAASLPLPARAGVAAPPAVRRVGPPLIELNGVRVRFADVTALHDVTLTVHRGERLVLVGANGSGKSTLLRVLHGLQHFEGGERRHLLQPEARPAVIAMLFQRPFLVGLSVRHNVMLGLWLRGVPLAQREARCRQALARVGLAAVADRPARALSGGQQQRLALARAWALQPDMLLLDEPTASLDPGAKREIEALIEEIGAQVTLVMSTHNLGQAKRLADRVAYMEGGRLVTVLPTERFFRGGELPAEAAQFLRGELSWS